MNKNTRLELIAYVFEKCTGKLAPFKDTPAALSDSDMEIRYFQWQQFMSLHEIPLNLLLDAVVEHFLRPNDK